jgi:uncharacterized membrane protein (DUF4010 family)
MMASLGDVFLRLSIAVGLGLLVGLQRERTQSQLGGVRTFPMVTVLGTVCALLGQSFGGWTLAAGFLGLAALIIAMNAISNLAIITSGKSDAADTGLTTEAAMLLMFGVGAYLVVGYPEVAIAVGGGLAVLLHLKTELHGFTAKLEEGDVRAIMQFALISLVILPVLPNRTYGPYDVLNPREVWLMVVLIVGISLGGYILYKFLGSRTGLVLGGVLGGLISSTATTVSYAKRTANAPETSSIAAVVLTIASAIVYARLLAEIAAVAPGFLAVAAAPIGVMLGLMAALAAGTWYFGAREESAMPPQENPAELKSALVFGLLYAVVLLVVAAVRDRFGARGLYVVAVISGLTDVDAITLSTSNMVGAQRLDASSGWRVILLASLSNLVFKAGMVAVLGNRRLLLRIAVIFGIALGAGIVLLLLWP